MTTTLTPIFSGTPKIIAPIHKYNAKDTAQDVIVIVDGTYDVVHYIVMDNVFETIISRDRLTIIGALKQNIADNFKDTTADMLVIQNVFGVHNTNNIDVYTTLFLEIKHKFKNRRYLVQLNITDNDVTTAETLLVETHMSTENIYMNTFIRDNVFINDYKTINTTDAYIAYINVDGIEGTDIANAGIQGLRLLVTDEEKADFVQTMGITIPETVFPVVDIWSEDAFTFFNLTADTIDVKFNFSTGLGFLKFKELSV